MVKYELLVAQISEKAGWKFVSMVHGLQYVEIIGIWQKHQLYASNLDMLFKVGYKTAKLCASIYSQFYYALWLLDSIATKLGRGNALTINCSGNENSLQECPISQSPAYCRQLAGIQCEGEVHVVVKKAAAD